MPSILAASLGAAAFICVLLSALFGISNFSNWLLDGAQGLFIVAVIIFLGYVISGILRDARTQ